jgi:plastocyanin
MRQTPAITRRSTVTFPIRTVALLLAPGVALVAGGCTADPIELPPTAHVQIVGNEFRPQVVTINPGEWVDWAFPTGVAHTVTPNNPQQPGAWEAIVYDGQGGFTAAIHLEVPGQTYDYHCDLHPSMTGRIIVTTQASTTGRAPRSGG